MLPNVLVKEKCCRFHTSLDDNFTFLPERLKICQFDLRQLEREVFLRSHWGIGGVKMMPCAVPRLSFYTWKGCRMSLRVTYRENRKCSAFAAELASNQQSGERWKFGFSTIYANSLLLLIFWEGVILLGHEHKTDCGPTYSEINLLHIIRVH